MPFAYKHLAVMPDVHLGKGATIGSVIATEGAVIPAAVGVDLGCGMMAVRTDLTASDLPDDLHPLRTEIERVIPHGRTNNGQRGDRGAWGEASSRIIDTVRPLRTRLEPILAKHPLLDRGTQRIFTQAGTLGTGNHFVEVCLDLEQRVWIMLHSGSRGIGNSIGTYFIQKAKEEMQRWFINLPDQDLAYLPEGSKYYQDYLEAVGWAQDYARLNREIMMTAARNALARTLRREITCTCSAVNCHHNYVSTEKHFGKQVLVTRKGAVSAQDGELGIIPGSMGARSFIVRGKGNRESFCSCSHGAGRVMSRTEAKRRFSQEDHVAAVAGVECRTDADVIDETPAAYKRIEDVMAAQVDLVDVVHELKQVLCVKG
jgi:tRNA-splicing ligase RtcB